MPYPQQLAQKQQQLAALLAKQQPFQLLPAVASAEHGFRYKAKMVVLGSVAAPQLGIVNVHGEVVDLTDCPLYPSSFAPVFAAIKQLIQQAGLVPYDVTLRSGELKFILLNQSQHSGNFMLRFVLRSKNYLALLKKHLPTLLAKVPQLQVVSVNIQPKAAAILEGSEEIVLSSSAVLREQLNQIPLYLTPQSFFQTNPSLASALYQTAAAWALALHAQGEQIQHIWDLFCGVGGFGLALSQQFKQQCALEVNLVGIEIAPAAIASARKAAAELGLTKVSFQALDSAAFTQAAQQAPDLLVVNPPRRGLGAALCHDINRLKPRWLLYSSCNATTLAADLATLKGYQLCKAQLFDLFAHSSHSEVLTLLKRQSND